MKAALVLIDIASRLMPAHRHVWAQAMRSEFLTIGDHSTALAFALGCVWAAITERIACMKPVVTTGRILIGSVTALYAMLFGASAIMELAQPQLRNLQWPWLMPWQAAMALTNLTAAVFLVVWRPRPFFLACAAAALAGVPLLIIGGISADGRPMAWAWPIIPVILLTASAAALAWLDRRPRRTTYRPR